ncbi:MAG: sugar phosphate nucleotidyltransferase [Flavobacteriales bacterium]|nr:sugar phosphate nucleotidyltransferase [Flavobacteriales bacterium]
MAHQPHTYAVIMAGGIGSRFWPMSRSAEPKQFLDILGTGRSLIRMTFDRLEKLVPADRILVVTNARYRDQVATHLPEMPVENILCEPFMRNTAPCIAYANAVIASRDPEAAVVVAPSDHLILDEQGFLDVCCTALETTRNTTSLVTLGIQPTRPDTGYGYIQYEEPHDEAQPGVRPVKTFTEKPDLATAETFLASGEFCWNSGIFVWSLSNIQAAFDKHLPDMLAEFADADLSDTVELNAVYGNCENISIDYGIMEKASHVQVVLCDIGWSDLGTWGSLKEKLDTDADGNASAHVRIRAVDARDNLVVGSPSATHGPQKLVALKGLEGYIVVDTPHALLVCPATDEQWIKELVGDLKRDEGEPLV